MWHPSWGIVSSFRPVDVVSHLWFSLNVANPFNLLSASVMAPTHMTTKVFENFVSIQIALEGIVDCNLDAINQTVLAPSKPVQTRSGNAPDLDSFSKSRVESTWFAAIGVEALWLTALATQPPLPPLTQFPARPIKRPTHFRTARKDVDFALIFPAKLRGGTP